MFVFFISNIAYTVLQYYSVTVVVAGRTPWEAVSQSEGELKQHIGTDIDTQSGRQDFVWSSGCLRKPC